MNVFFCSILLCAILMIKQTEQQQQHQQQLAPDNDTKSNEKQKRKTTPPMKMSHIIFKAKTHPVAYSKQTRPDKQEKNLINLKMWSNFSKLKLPAIRKGK